MHGTYIKTVDAQQAMIILYMLLVILLLLTQTLTGMWHISYYTNIKRLLEIYHNIARRIPFNVIVNISTFYDKCLINPLNTKRRLLYLKTQFVPRSKHFSSRL